MSTTRYLPVQSSRVAQLEVVGLTRSLLGNNLKIGLGGTHNYNLHCKLYYIRRRVGQVA